MPARLQLLFLIQHNGCLLQNPIGRRGGRIPPVTFQQLLERAFQGGNPQLIDLCAALFGIREGIKDLSRSGNLIVVQQVIEVSLPHVVVLDPCSAAGYGKQADRCFEDSLLLFWGQPLLIREAIEELDGCSGCFDDVQ